MESESKEEEMWTIFEREGATLYSRCWTVDWPFGSVTSMETGHLLPADAACDVTTVAAARQQTQTLQCISDFMFIQIQFFPLAYYLLLFYFIIFILFCSPVTLHRK